jgi:protein phosphatase
MDEITEVQARAPGQEHARLVLTAYGATDIGQIRVHNEDAVLLRPDLHLYILADGAGGHNAGNVASALATTSIANYFEGTQAAWVSKPEFDAFGLATGARRVAAAIQRANRDIVEIAKTSNKYQGMGTTAVVLFASPESGLIHIGHVGDSRCYRLRSGYIEQMTFDHSLINEVLELRPDVDDDKISHLPRHVVTRALGMAESVRVSVRTYQMVVGDRYLLCSDGLTEMLDDETIGVKLGEKKRPEEIARTLIEGANMCGGTDNIGVLVVACDELPQGAPMPLIKRPRPLKTQKLINRAPEMRGTFGSAPEIIILGMESVSERLTDSESKITIVPADSETPSLRNAFAGLTRKKAPPDDKPKE